MLDWAAASRGDAAVDAALTYVILRSTAPPPGLAVALGQRAFAEAFAAAFGRARLCPQVARAARLRLRDDAVKRSVREEEIVAALSAASGCETSWLCCGLGASARGLLAGDHETVPVAMARGDL